MLMLTRFLLSWKRKPPMMVIRCRLAAEEGCEHILRALPLMEHEHRRPALLSQGLPHVVLEAL